MGPMGLHLDPEWGRMSWRERAEAALEV